MITTSSSMEIAITNLLMLTKNDWKKQEDSQQDKVKIKLLDVC